MVSTVKLFLRRLEAGDHIVGEKLDDVARFPFRRGGVDDDVGEGFRPGEVQTRAV